MLGVADMYGHSGPDSGGDPHVADLLKRTYTKLRAVDEDWRRLRSTLDSAVYTLPLPQMTTLYNHWISTLLWQVALVFADGVIALNEAEPTLPDGVYRVADTLCGDAATQTRRTKTAKPVLAQQADMPHLPNNARTYMGVWDACIEIVDQIGGDLETVTNLGVPSRMTDIHEATTKTIHTHTANVKALRDDWESTTTAENRMELAQQLLPHAAEIFKAGQQLWAPYMVGDKYKEALHKEKSLDELDLRVDPWILTDPRRTGTITEAKLISFWESVTNREAIPALVADVDNALRTGKIRRRTDHAYPTFPWQSQFLVIRPVTLGDVAFQPRQLCAYYPARNSTGVTVEMRRVGIVRNILELYT